MGELSYIFGRFWERRVQFLGTQPWLLQGIVCSTQIGQRKGLKISNDLLRRVQGPLKSQSI